MNRLDDLDLLINYSNSLRKSCSQRYYDALKPILDRYKRPITVLDLGAGYGYFSFRMAQDYDSTCVMVEDNKSHERQADQLLELCHMNSQLHNIVLLNKKMSLTELTKLADCEYFDVVLAFDYIDPADYNWKRTIDEILRLGDNVFIRAPWSNVESNNIQNKAAIQYLVQRSGKLILQTPSAHEPSVEEQLFLFEQKKDGLRSKYFFRESKDSNVKVFHINSTYSQKTFTKKGAPSPTEWKKGINLVTFLALNGTYPTKYHIKQTIAGLTHEKLTDFTPWNLILQGNKLILIDQKDKDYNVNVQKSLKFIYEVIDQTTPQGIKDLFDQFGQRHVRHHKFNLFSWL